MDDAVAEDRLLICWGCCYKLIELCGIPHGSSAFTRVLRKKTRPCMYCGMRMSLDDIDIAQWVPMSAIIGYEIAMAFREENKKKLKSRTALEVIQSKLLVDTFLRQVYGPFVDRTTSKVERRSCDVLKVVHARTKRGVELRSDQGPLGELQWPQARFVRLTTYGFEFVDEDENKLVAYDWHEEAQLAAQ